MKKILSVLVILAILLSSIPVYAEGGLFAFGYYIFSLPDDFIIDSHTSDKIEGHNADMLEFSVLSIDWSSVGTQFSPDYKGITDALRYLYPDHPITDPSTTGMKNGALYILTSDFIKLDDTTIQEYIVSFLKNDKMLVAFFSNSYLKSAMTYLKVTNFIDDLIVTDELDDVIEENGRLSVSSSNTLSEFTDDNNLELGKNINSIISDYGYNYYCTPRDEDFGPGVYSFTFPSFAFKDITFDTASFYVNKLNYIMGFTLQVDYTPEIEKVVKQLAEEWKDYLLDKYGSPDKHERKVRYFNGYLWDTIIFYYEVVFDDTNIPTRINIVLADSEYNNYNTLDVLDSFDNIKQTLGIRFSSISPVYAFGVLYDRVIYAYGKDVDYNYDGLSFNEIDFNVTENKINNITYYVEKTRETLKKTSAFCDVMIKRYTREFGNPDTEEYIGESYSDKKWNWKNIELSYSPENNDNFIRITLISK